MRSEKEKLPGEETLSEKGTLPGKDTVKIEKEEKIPSQEAGMTSGTPWKVLLRFALPLMAANMLQQLYNTVDTLVVGNFDSQLSLSAVGSCSYLVMLFLALAMGLSLGAGVLAAQALGAGDEEKLRRIGGTGIVFLLAVGAVMTGVIWFAGPFVLRGLIHVPEEIYELSVLYLRTYCLGTVFQYGYNAVAALLRSMGDSKSSLYFLLVTSAANVVLDILFVVVFHMSVAGVGLATTISQGISMAAAFWYMFRKYPMFGWDRRYYRIKAELVKKIVATGIPMALSQMVTSVGFMLLQRVVNSYGVDMAASYTVACRLEIYMLVPNNSIANAMSTYAGQNYGAGKPDRIYRGNRQASLLLLGLDGVIGVLVFFFARPLTGLFNLHGPSVAYCITHLRIVSFDFLIHALRSPVTGVFQGVGKTKLSMYGFMLEILVRLVSAYALTGIIGPGAVWWPEVIAFGVSAAFIWYLYLSEIWKRDLQMEEAGR